MSLQSFGFFGFLLVVAVVYLHLPQRLQRVFLLGASWVFYALAMPAMLPVTIAIAAVSYTHLDVYKRQGQAGQLLAELRQVLGLLLAEAGVLQQNDISVVPVSYTHLALPFQKVEYPSV